MSTGDALEHAARKATRMMQIEKTVGLAKQFGSHGWPDPAGFAALGGLDWVLFFVDYLASHPLRRRLNRAAYSQFKRVFDSSGDGIRPYFNMALSTSGGAWEIQAGKNIAKPTVGHCGLALKLHAFTARLFTCVLAYGLAQKTIAGGEISAYLGWPPCIDTLAEVQLAIMVDCLTDRDVCRGAQDTLEGLWRLLAARRHAVHDDSTVAFCRRLEDHGPVSDEDYGRLASMAVGVVRFYVWRNPGGHDLCDIFDGGDADFGELMDDDADEPEPPSPVSSDDDSPGDQGPCDGGR